MPKSPLQLLAIIHNRLVPEWLMRFRYIRVLRFPTGTVPREIPEGLIVAWARTQSEVETAIATAKNPLEPADRMGHRAAVAYRDGNPVAAVWVARGQFFERESGIRFDLPPRSAWIYCAHVAKPHRNQGIYRALLAFVLEELAAAGDDAAFAAVNPFNHDSVRSHRHFGAPIGTVCAGRLFAIACGCATRYLTIDRRWSWNCYYRPMAVAIREGIETDGAYRDERQAPSTSAPRKRE